MQRRNVLILGSAAYPPRLEGIAEIARKRGWNVFYNRLIDRPIILDCDGAIVLLSNDSRDLKIVKSLIRRSIPVVDLSIIRKDIHLPRVIGDNLAIGQISAEHFNANGFTCAACFSCAWSFVHQLRFKGFAASFRGKTARWIWPEQTKGLRNSARRFCTWLERTIQAAPKPIAVFTYDDADAACLLAACIKLGVKVPEDVAILGVDNDKAICENQTIPLSSVQHDQIGLARLGAELLDRLMSGKRPPAQPILVPPLGIVTRASTDVIATTDPKLRKALAFLRANLGKPVGIDQVAEFLGVSRSSIKRLFLKEIGVGVPGTLSRLRLSKAKALLSESDIRLSEIAERCGFCNAAYLTNSFKSAFKVTPGKWRKTQAHHVKTISQCS